MSKNYVGTAIIVLLGLVALQVWRKKAEVFPEPEPETELEPDPGQIRITDVLLKPSIQPDHEFDMYAVVEDMEPDGQRLLPRIVVYRPNGTSYGIVPRRTFWNGKPIYLWWIRNESDVGPDWYPPSHIVIDLYDDPGEVLLDSVTFEGPWQAS